MICTAMSGNGARIGMGFTRAAVRPIRLAQLRDPAASIAAAAGSTSRMIVAPRAGTTTSIPACGATTWASAWPSVQSDNGVRLTDLDGDSGHAERPRSATPAQGNSPRTHLGARRNAPDPGRRGSTVVRPQNPPRRNALRRTPKLTRPQTASLARPPFRHALRCAAGALRRRPAGARTSASPCLADAQRDRSAPRRRGPGLRPFDA
jgi:hypothetical protein